jgi:hypothetical protein
VAPQRALSYILPCMLATCLVPCVAVAQGGVAPLPEASAPSSAPDQPDQSLQDAVASVVVVALTEQFDGRVISVKIDDYNVTISSARERLVSGRGTVEMGAQGSDAVSFTYRTLYDVVDAHAGYPSITVSGFPGGGERLVPNDARLIGQLDERVAAALSGELGGKQVWLQLDQIESYESGGRYVRINASGLADFGVDGRTPARVEALYDRSGDAWLRVNYALGAAVPISMAGLQAVR